MAPRYLNDCQYTKYLNKTHVVKFASSKLLTYPLNIAYNNQALTVTENIKFLGMHLDFNLT